MVLFSETSAGMKCVHKIWKVEELHHLTALHNAIFSTATVQLFSCQFSWWSQIITLRYYSRPFRPIIFKEAAILIVTGYLEIYIQYKNHPTVHQFYNITHLHFSKYIEESLHELDGFFCADVSWSILFLDLVYGRLQIVYSWEWPKFH